MYLGFLCGQRSFSATLIDLSSGNTILEATINYDDDFPYRHTDNGHLVGYKPGEYYSDPQMWAESIDTVLDRLVEKGADLSQVKVISGTAIPSLIFLNDHWEQALSELNPNLPLNEQLRPVYTTRVSPASIDTSASRSAETIRSKFPRDSSISQIIGSRLDSSKGAAQIHQLHTASRDTWDQTSVIHVTSSFIHSILIGKSAPLDLSDTTQLGLYDIKQSEWHEEILDCTAPNLKEKLPSLTKSNNASGPLSDYFIFKYQFSKDAQCYPWISRDAAIALSQGLFEPNSSLLRLENRYEYINYISKLPEEIPNHSQVLIHPMGGYLTRFTLNNGIKTFNQTVKKLGLDLNKIQHHLDAIPSSRNLPSLPFLKKESDHISKSDQSKTTILSLVTGQILHLQLFSQWADESSTNLTITGEGSKIRAIRVICADIFQLPAYHQAENNNEIIGTMIPYLISEHESISDTLRKLISNTQRPDTTPEAFMAGFYTNQLKEYFQLLTSHLNQ